MASKLANTKKLRVVVLGNDRKEKTELINAILGKERTEVSLGSECKVIEGVFEKESVVFIDTPSLLSTRLDKKKLAEELMRCILYAAPGPHVFLYVKKNKPFTTEEEHAVKVLEGTLKNSESYFFGVFASTKVIPDGDRDVIQSSFMGKFSGYVTFNPKDPSVSELMKKIKQMAEKQGHYKHELCEKAEKLRTPGESVEAIAEGIIGGLAGKEFYGLLNKFLDEMAKKCDKVIQRSEGAKCVIQ